MVMYKINPSYDKKSCTGSTCYAITTPRVKNKKIYIAQCRVLLQHLGVMTSHQWYIKVKFGN